MAQEKEYFAHETAVVDNGAKIGKGTHEPGTFLM